MQMTRFSITAASGIQLKTALNRSHAHRPPSSPVKRNRQRWSPGERKQVNSADIRRTEALDALNTEPKQRIDVRSLVIAAQQMHVLGVFDLQAAASQRFCAR